MDFLTLARERYSERFFDPRPLEEAALAQILEAGRLAPTACNYQPQRIFVLGSAEALARVDTLTRSRCGAPLVLLVAYDEEIAWHNPRDHYCGGDQDASIAASSMMFAAQSLGVHSLWIRGFDAAAVTEAFALPARLHPVMMLALGYPSPQSAPHPWHTKRIPLDEMVTRL